MDTDLESLVSSFPELEVIKGAKRIRCKLNGHEMPFKYEAVLKFTIGKKFKLLQENAKFSFDSYKPFIIESEKRKNCQFCTLTGKYMSRVPQQVEKHVKGQNYLYQKALYDVGKTKLIDEVPKEEKVEKERLESDNEEDVVEDDEMECIEEINESKVDRKRKLKDSPAEKSVTMSNKKLKLLKKKRLSLTKGTRLIETM